MSIVRTDYPPEWPTLRARILRRSRNAEGLEQCECMGECGLHSLRGPRRGPQVHGPPATFLPPPRAAKHPPGLFTSSSHLPPPTHNMTLTPHYNAAVDVLTI